MAFGAYFVVFCGIFGAAVLVFGLEGTCADVRRRGGGGWMGRGESGEEGSDWCDKEDIVENK